MTQENFYKLFRKHDGEDPKKVFLEWDGYELHYQNGDTYKHTMKLKEEAYFHRFGNTYFADDFIYKSEWNGENIL